MFAEYQSVVMSDAPPGESQGSRHGDARLDQRARHLTGGGAVMEVFRVREEGDTLNIRCQVSNIMEAGRNNYHECARFVI